MTEPFDSLLLLQEHDTHLDQLEHRRDTMPERTELADTIASTRALSATLAEVQARLDDVAKRQGDLEADVAASEARIVQIDKRLYSGEITAGRDLQAMTDEINSLKRRVSGLEDRVIEAMEEREPIDAEAAELTSQLDALVDKRAALEATIVASTAEIEAELVAERAERESIIGRVPADLLTKYEALRARLGGIGAARLEHGSCMGCHLSLPAIEVDRLKNLPSGELAFCDQCGRILVP